MTGTRTGGTVDSPNCSSLVHAEFMNWIKPLKLKCPLCGGEWYVKDEDRENNSSQKTA